MSGKEGATRTIHKGQWGKRDDETQKHCRTLPTKQPRLAVK